MDPNNKPLPIKVMGTLLRGLSLFAPRATGNIYAKLMQKPDRGQLRAKDQALLATATRLETDGAITAWLFNNDEGKSGTHNDKPIALLVHGWSFRGVHLSGFVQPLLDAGYQVVMVDLPAHGEATGERTSPLHTTEALREFVWQLGEVDTVIAHSFGALCAMRLIRSGWKVNNAVTLACPKVYIFEEYIRYIGCQQRSRRHFINNLSAFDGGKAPDTANLMDDDAPESQLNHCRWLLLHSADDGVVAYSEHAEALSRRYPSAQLHTLNGVGHTKILWDSATINATMDFLPTHNI